MLESKGGGKREDRNQESKHEIIVLIEIDQRNVKEMKEKERVIEKVSR